MRTSPRASGFSRIFVILILGGSSVVAWQFWVQKNALHDELSRSQGRISELEERVQRQKGLLVSVRQAQADKVSRLQAAIVAEQSTLEALQARFLKLQNGGVGGENQQSLQEALKEARAKQAALEQDLRGFDQDQNARTRENMKIGAQTKVEWRAALEQLTAQIRSGDDSVRQLSAQLAQYKGRKDPDSVQQAQDLRSQIEKQRAAVADLKAQKQQYRQGAVQQNFLDNQQKNITRGDDQKSRASLVAQLQDQKRVVSGLEERMKALQNVTTGHSRDQQDAQSALQTEQDKIKELQTQLSREQAELDQFDK